MAAPQTLEPLSANTLHVVIDMQRLFAETTAWHNPGLADILPAVLKLSEARFEKTIFARFMTPDNPGSTHGRWRRYYERWTDVTAQGQSGLLDLVAPLAALATPHAIVEKTIYSVFGSEPFVRMLEARGTDTLVMSGVETDVCVLASIFDAVDRGYRVVVPADAVASGSDAAHSAVLTHVLPRLREQIDVTTVDDILRGWTG